MTASFAHWHDHLRRQRSQLVERIARLKRMVHAVDRMMEASRPGMRLTPEEQVEIFGADWQPAWVEEAEDRWGDSAQWAQYAQRAARMTPEDWKATAAATETLSADLAAAKRAGVAPGSDAANALAERHRAMISAYLDCTHAMQVCVGRMYVDDPGYAEYYDALAPGLTVWLREVDLRERRGAGRRPGVREVGVIAARPGAGRPGAGAAATVGAGQSTGTSVR